MDIKINREDRTQSVNNITITVGEKEFRISQNNLGELIVNKYCFNEESSTIQILPRVSNEIELK